LENKRFNLNYKCVDRVLVVEFSGYLGAGLTETLVAQIEWRLAQGCRDFVFDFAGVSMLESAAVAGILATTEKIVDECGGDLAFTSLNDGCNKVLEMVGVFLYAGRFSDTEAAIAEMAG
jgi:anti-anti-sigma factor